MKKQWKAEELSVFCIEIALVLESGIPLGEGIGMLVPDARDKEAAKVLAGIKRAVEEGGRLSAALEQAGVFSAYFVHMAEIGEKTGRQEETFRALSAYYDRQAQLAAHIRTAVLGPALLLLMMVAVVAVLVVRVMPIFNDVYAQLGLEMSGPARSLLLLGAALERGGAPILLAIGVAAALCLALALVPALRARIAAWGKETFGGRGLWGRISSARFAYAMATTTSTGLDIEDTLGLAARICGDVPSVVRKIALIREDLVAGKPLADAVAESGLLSAQHCRTLAVGAGTGALDTAFEEIARRSDVQVNDEVEAAVGRIEPMMVIVTSALVGLILLAVMLPLATIMSSL